MNVFEQQAQRQANGAQRAQWRADDKAAAKANAKAAIPPMVLHGLQKKQHEKAQQMKRYIQWKREVREGMSRGDYGPEIIDLLKLLRSPKARDLVYYIANAHWLHACALDVKLTVLGYIDQAIIRHQIRNGYAPFDDSIPSFNGTPDPPRNAFLHIRLILTGV